MTRLLGLLPALLLLAACGGGRNEVTIYLKQRLGPNAPPGQIAPVLMPVPRAWPHETPLERQVIIELRQGPAPDERAQGFRDTVRPTTWLRSIGVGDGVVTVNLKGAEPDLYASAAIVYSLTDLTGVHAVRLRLDGRPCCVYDHAGKAVPALARSTFRSWQGEPCPLRTQRDSVPCRNA